ncbi:MAG: dTDP-4-dehydrorhamnose 3,5-epimerase [Fibrobacterota bacterium]
MKLRTTFFDSAVKLIEPAVFSDARGSFFESFRQRTLAAFGIAESWVQDNVSFSAQMGVIRGIHLQLPPSTQSKLIYAAAGEILDVFVDLRKNSPTYGSWNSTILSGTNHHILYIPKGFGHGFAVLQDETTVIYKCSDYYAPESEITLDVYDPDLSIHWPSFPSTVISQKDMQGQPFSAFKSPF